MTIHRIAAIALLALAGTSAQATLITFDDLTWTRPDDGSFSDQPVTTQYASQGVVFNGAYLDRGYDTPYATLPGQYLLGAVDFTITFTGVLPTYVAFNLNSPTPPSQTTAYAVESGRPQIVEIGNTGGEVAGEVGPITLNPYVPNTPVWFHSDNGIQTLTFGTYNQGRLSAVLDNLYFGSVAPVPEPATVALLAAGLGLLAFMRRRRPSAANRQV